MEKQISISKRISAYLLDIFLVYCFMSLVTSIRFINPTYDKLLEVTNTYSEKVDKYNKKEINEKELLEANNVYLYKATKYNISTNIAIIVVIIAYFGLFQKYNNGQTLGKKIMKIKVTGVDNKSVSLCKYILRLMPMYFFLIGSIIPLILNSILVFVLNMDNFILVNSISVYAFFILAIISFTMAYIRKDHRGLHDIIAGTKVELE